MCNAGDRQAVGTENGDVLICDGTDLKATMHSVSSGRAITAIAAHAKVGDCKPVQHQSFLLQPVSCER